MGGTEPYEIVWSGEFGELGSGPLIEALGEGEYSVVLEDGNGCTADLSFSLTANDDAFSFSLGPDTTLCEDDQLVLSAPAGLNYLWSNGSVDQFIIVNAAELGPGTYPITVEASNEFGCSHADAIFVTVYDCTTGVDDLDPFKGGPSVHPNPATGGTAWTIRWPESGRTARHAWTLRDVVGREVASGTFVDLGTGNPLRIDTADLPAGQYFLSLNEQGEALRLVRH